MGLRLKSTHATLRILVLAACAGSTTRGQHRVQAPVLCYEGHLTRSLMHRSLVACLGPPRSWTATMTALPTKSWELYGRRSWPCIVLVPAGTST